MVCEQSEESDCFCASQTLCKPGCSSDEDCDVSQECSPTHHCVVRTCGVSNPCPVYFGCVSGGAPFDYCRRLTCTQDNTCGSGACVEGYCYAEPGVCSFIPG